MPDRRSLFLAALLLAATPAAAQEAPAVSPEVGQALDALSEGNPTRAAAFLRGAAENGDVNAQAILGELYLSGEGVTRDVEIAARWLRAAAANGHGAAAYALAQMTEQGLATPPGVTAMTAEQRNEEVARLLLKAANGGSLPAKIAIGERYARGDGVPKDYLQAARWLREAADEGEPHAQYGLGVLHLTGTLAGGTPDPGAALPWFQKAAAQNLASAQYQLGLMASHGLGRPQDDAEAVSWFRKAAEQDDLDAMVDLATFAYQGRGMAKDEAEAARLFTHAAEAGHPVAQDQLSRLYVMGRGVDKDMAEAWKWHTLAGRGGYPDPELDKRFAKDLSAEARAEGDARAARWLDARAKAAPQP